MHFSLCVDSSVLVPGLVYAEFVIIARQNHVQQDSCDGCNGKCSQGDGRSAGRKGETVAEAQSADKDDARDDQVSRFGQVYFILYHVAHTDGRNHTVQHEADASDDRGRHGADECRYLRNEADDNRKDCGNTDDSRVMYAAQFQNAGVLAVRRVGWSADETCHCGCKTIAEQGSMQARIRKEVLSYGCRDRRHAPSWSRSRSVP